MGFEVLLGGVSNISKYSILKIRIFAHDVSTAVLLEYPLHGRNLPRPSPGAGGLIQTFDRLTPPDSIEWVGDV